MSIFRPPNPIQINGRFKSFLIHLCDKTEVAKSSATATAVAAQLIIHFQRHKYTWYLHEILFSTFSLAIDKFIATIHNIGRVNWMWSSFCWLFALASASASAFGYCCVCVLCLYFNTFADEFVACKLVCMCVRVQVLYCFHHYYYYYIGE